MKKTIEDMEIRIHKLQTKDPVGNANIIRKLKREIKNMKDVSG